MTCDPTTQEILEVCALAVRHSLRKTTARRCTHDELLSVAWEGAARSLRSWDGRVGSWQRYVLKPCYWAIVHYLRQTGGAHYYGAASPRKLLLDNAVSLSGMVGGEEFWWGVTTEDEPDQGAILEEWLDLARATDHERWIAREKWILGRSWRELGEELGVVGETVRGRARKLKERIAEVAGV